MVDPGNPPHSSTSRTKTHSTRRCHRMVALAARSSGRSTEISSQTKITTVMLVPNLAVVVDSGIIHRDWSQLKRLRHDDRFAKGPGLRERPTSEPAFGSIELGYWRVRGACSGRQRTQYSSPAFYFGKGFGDLPGYLGWLRPFAVTDEFALEIRNRYPDPPVAELLR